MIVDALLAWLHFMLVFGLCGCLLAELFFYGRELSRSTLRRLQRVDIAFGALAAAVVVSGVVRVIFSPKGAAFFVHNPIFWTKMGLFGALGLLSIAPTLHYIALGRTAAGEANIRVGDGAFKANRNYLFAEVILLLLIPCCAAFMARGFH
jgi:putative membrane protein